LGIISLSGLLGTKALTDDAEVLLTVIGVACVLVGILGFWSDDAARSVHLPGTRSQRLRFGIVASIVGVLLITASRS
jgi:hypothetical protein